MATNTHSAPLGASNTPASTDTIQGNHPDAVILAAFNAYAQGRKAIWDATDDEAVQLWNAVDAADQTVYELPATTPAGIMAKLWLGLIHSTEDAGPDEAAVHNDIGWFEAQGDQIDWGVRHIVSAIRALKTMEA
jgi:hypothetical protein